MRGTWVAGASVWITNGGFSHVGFAYHGPDSKNLTMEPVRPVNLNRDEQPPKLRFFVVNDDPVDGGRFIDTSKFPKLGYIAATPDLMIGWLKRITMNEQLVTDSENRQHTNWSFNLTLPEEFVPQLKAMTEMNISKRVLIMLGEESILAPTIVSPLETAEIAVSVSERSSMENLKRSISRMTQAGR
jgi:hypothetical protein